MPTLTHFSFCPHSRAIRLVLAEIGREPALVQMLPWEWSDALLALNLCEVAAKRVFLGKTRVLKLAFDLG